MKNKYLYSFLGSVAFALLAFLPVSNAKASPAPNYSNGYTPTACTYQYNPDNYYTTHVTSGSADYATANGNRSCDKPGSSQLVGCSSQTIYGFNPSLNQCVTSCGCTDIITNGVNYSPPANYYQLSPSQQLDFQQGNGYTFTYCTTDTNTGGGYEIINSGTCAGDPPTLGGGSCGASGQTCCSSGSACNSGLSCQSNDTCGTDTIRLSNDPSMTVTQGNTAYYYVGATRNAGSQVPSVTYSNSCPAGTSCGLQYYSQNFIGSSQVTPGQYMIVPTTLSTTPGTYTFNINVNGDSSCQGSCSDSGTLTLIVQPAGGASPGVCGPAATPPSPTYSATATSYAGAYCANGLASSNPPFPYAGQSTPNWTCDTGDGSATCNASRACVTVNYQSATSGFSNTANGSRSGGSPAGQAFVVGSQGQAFYSFCDYGAVSNSIGVNSGGLTCSYQSFSGTAAQFFCNAPNTGTASNVAFSCQTNNGVSSGNIALDACTANNSATAGIIVAAAPAITVDSPAPGATLSGTTLVKGYVIADSHATITKVEFWTQSNPVLVASSDASAGTPPYTVGFYPVAHGAQGNTGFTLNYDTTQLVDGPHNFIVKAYDNLGDVTTKTVAVTIQNTVLPTDPTGGPISTNNPPVNCGQVQLNWTDNSTNETGFYIYADGGNAPVATAPASSPASSVGAMSFVYTPPDNNSHTYTVAAFNAGGTSNKVNETSGSIASLACGPNLTTSNKEITAVNGNVVANASTYVCQGQTNPLSSTSVVNNGDTISFQINVCNNTAASNATATVTTIVDTMTNLQIPKSGNWNAKYCQGASCSSITPAVSGSTLTFTINKDVPYGINAAPGVLTYDAMVSAQPSTAYGRFQNSAVINYGVNQTWNVNTPLVLYYTGSQAPTRQETAP